MAMAGIGSGPVVQQGLDTGGDPIAGLSARLDHARRTGDMETVAHLEQLLAAAKSSSPSVYQSGDISPMPPPKPFVETGSNVQGLPAPDPNIQPPMGAFGPMPIDIVRGPERSDPNASFEPRIGMPDMPTPDAEMPGNPYANWPDFYGAPNPAPLDNPPMVPVETGGPPPRDLPTDKDPAHTPSYGERPNSTLGDPGSGKREDYADSIWTGVFGENGTGWQGVKDNWSNLDPDKKNAIFEAMIAGGSAMMQAPGNFGMGLGAYGEAALGAYNDDMERSFDENLAEEDFALKRRNADLTYQAEMAKLELAQRTLNDPNATEADRLNAEANRLQAARRLEMLKSGRDPDADVTDLDRFEDRVAAAMQPPPNGPGMTYEEAVKHVGRLFAGSKGREFGDTDAFVDDRVPLDELR